MSAVEKIQMQIGRAAIGRHATEESFAVADRRVSRGGGELPESTRNCLS